MPSLIPSRRWVHVLLAGVLLCGACEPHAAGQWAGETHEAQDHPARPTPSALATASESLTPRLPRYGKAPELEGITGWLNSEPLSMTSLRGQVVLVEFWTFGCINCVHTLPYVSSWYERYKDRGLVVIGVHTPELAFEREPGRVRTAVEQHGLTYPIAIDADYATWRAYGNRYWPALYFVDRSGEIRFTQFGEGNQLQCERVIRALLDEKRGRERGNVPSQSSADAD